ncbi:TPA: hypothetical protein QCJ74_002948 [Enterobacter mori]|nr:hypothetical protein [Enterobacter mori]HDR2778969.1 hypothetical protein [Enterobacter mori]
MSHKTKAAMQGRQCHYQKLKQSQDTRVNAGGQSLSAPVIAGTAPLARLRETTQKLGCLRCTALPHTQSPETSGELEQSAGCTAMQQTPEDFQSAFMHSGYQLFGSMPRCCNSLRIIRFIHADTEASPSCARACLIPSSRFGSTRNAICLLPLALISMVDIWFTPDYFEMVIKCMQVHTKKQRPGLLEQYQGV